ncbi:MAG: pyrimidine/purine nucleoside phosphorylase [Phycisphaeraceae bacterium]|nr:pyrimidine/purine nucleoside phosphorylase [Phycisphaeraceae bacterium]
MSHPTQFDNVTVVCKANVYFDGKVVSHTVLMADGSKKTVGLIYPGTYTFNTDAAEEMAITAGQCKVKLAGQDKMTGYGETTAFRVPAKSSFEISVESGICQYICSFVK